MRAFRFALAVALAAAISIATRPAAAQSTAQHGTGFYLPESMRNVKTDRVEAPVPAKGARALNPTASAQSWVDPNYVTTIKNQGSTGACWIFSEAAELEARINILNSSTSVDTATLTTPDYSEQDVANYYPESNFLLGGNAFMTASYFMQYGAANQTDEPWLNGLRGPWEPNLPRRVDLSGWRYYGSTSVSGIKTLLASGPVFSGMSTAVATDWDETWWSDNLVVPAEATATAEQLDHAVLIVGWDDNVLQGDGETLGAWLVKNSWGHTDGDGDGLFWIGYGAAGIGSAVSCFPLTEMKDQTVQEYRLSNDSGWMGDTSEIGPYVVNRFEGPRDGTMAVESLDVFAGQPGSACTITMYRGFETGYDNGTTGTVLATMGVNCPNVGIYNVAIPGLPLEIGPGDDIYVQMYWTDATSGLPIQTVAVASSYMTITGQTLVTEDQKEFWDVTRMGNYLFAGGSDAYLVDITDPDSPYIQTLLERTDPSPIRNLVAIGGRLILCQTGNEGTAGEDVAPSLPFVIYDIYNAGSWREVSLPFTFDLTLDHPSLPADYNTKAQATFYDTTFASRGNQLFLLANRYQGRYSPTSYRYRYWTDFGMMQWDLSDPYNVSKIGEQVYRQDAALDTVVSPSPTRWITDPDQSGDVSFGLDIDTSFNSAAGDIFGFNYRIDLAGTGSATYVQALDSADNLAPMALDKKAQGFTWDSNGDGTEDTVVVASVVNLGDETPEPGDPGDILFLDTSQDPPVLLSRLAAGDDVPLGAPLPAVALPIPASDFDIVHDFDGNGGDLMFIAGAQGGIVTVDVTDPTAPRVVDVRYLGDTFGLGDATAVTAWQDALNGNIYLGVTTNAGDLNGYSGAVVVMTYSAHGAYGRVQYPWTYFSRSGADGSWVDLYRHAQVIVPMRLRGRNPSLLPMQTLQIESTGTFYALASNPSSSVSMIDTGNSEITFPVNPSQWTDVYVYDYDTAQWQEAAYIYKQRN